MKKDDLLIELLCEELPPGVQVPAVEALAKGLESAFKEARLAFDGRRVFSTPRRLAVLFSGAAEKGEDISEKKRGPRIEAAFKDGQPTQAALGFAKGAGIPVEKLGRVKSDQGEFLEALIHRKGKTMNEVMGEALPDVLKNMPFPKVMRWGESAGPFSRPLRGLVLLHGKTVIPYTLFGVISGNQTKGPRTSGSRVLGFSHAKDYEAVLEQAGIIPDQEKRADLLAQAFDKAAAAIKGGRLRKDEELLATVTHDVENAFVLTGTFEARFLELPQEVIVTAMKEHQKYFAVEDSVGKLLPAFVAATGLPKSGKLVVSGHERVLRARLEDAKFYMTEDLKTTMEQKAAKLDQVVFIRDWGTMKDRTARLVRLAKALGGNAAAVGIAELCKADLVTQMIKDGKEFTKLQGAIGRLYAQRQGITGPIAEGIEQHYWPRFPGDGLPKTNEACLVALAEKADHIAAGFITGKIPTGSTDPFGLRRHAIGILNILRAKPEVRVGIGTLMAGALKGYTEQFPGKVDLGLSSKMSSFVLERLAQALKDDGLTADALQAVQASGEQDPRAFENKAKAITAWRGKPEAEKRLTALLRALRILNSDGAKADLGSSPNEAALSAASEKGFLAALAAIRDSFSSHVAAKRYAEAFAALEPLVGPIDAFFTEVMVMDKDPVIRRNRLALCSKVRELTIQLGDLTKLSG